MTMPIFMPTAVAPVRWWRRLLARPAVTAGRILATLEPTRLRLVLELLRRGARPATVPETQRALDAVLASSIRCRGEYCLQRSIATALLCRATGSWPEFRIGARPRPFKAHAWVSVDGGAVGELPETIRGLGTLLLISPVTSREVIT
jgi:hypothetical protein